MICVERTAADTVAWQVWWLPVVAKTHGIMESTLVECKTMITDWQTESQDEAPFSLYEIHRSHMGRRQDSFESHNFRRV